MGAALFTWCKDGTQFKQPTGEQNECTILLVLEVKKEISV
jgi:hypothetical protein